MRKFIFKDTVKNTELVLPVTPPSFEVSHGINIETINVNTLGDVILPGYGALASIQISCMLPVRKYPFNQPGTKHEPYEYIKKLEEWCDSHAILRFVVSDTTVNMQIVISDLSYGEKDGTGDVYATINLREYRKLSVVQMNKTGNKSRSAEKVSLGMQSYTIKKGDTLGAICRKYYGSASLASKLAAYNNIKNVNLIIVGKVIRLPDKKLL